MLVFIDESGCPGVLPDPRADPIFVLAMVVFANRAEAAETQFFRAIVHCEFSVVAIVVDKRRINAIEALRLDRERHLSFVKELLTLEVLRDVELKIDGPSDRRFSQGLRRTLAAHLRGRVRRMRMADSARDPLIQLADMCAGAIARAYRDRAEANRWLRMLRPRIREIREL
jgi:hypothetical protein